MNISQQLKRIWILFGALVVVEVLFSIIVGDCGSPKQEKIYFFLNDKNIMLGDVTIVVFLLAIILTIFLKTSGILQKCLFAVLFGAIALLLLDALEYGAPDPTGTARIRDIGDIKSAIDFYAGTHHGMYPHELNELSKDSPGIAPLIFQDGATKQNYDFVVSEDQMSYILCSSIDPDRSDTCHAKYYLRDFLSMHGGVYGTFMGLNCNYPYYCVGKIR